jgi:hypothetical protein
MNGKEKLELHFVLFREYGNSECGYEVESNSGSDNDRG